MRTPLYRRLFLAVCALLVAGTAMAAGRDGVIVSTAWLRAHLRDPNLVLLHVGEKDKYADRHIAGARLVSLQDISISDHSGKGLMLEMPLADDLRKRLEALGISDDSRIILYYAQDWLTPATRILFTLDYAGLGDRASLLDGGIDAWVRADGEVTKEVPAKRTGKLSALKTRPLIVDAAFVRSHVGKPGFAVVDGRASAFYDGVDTGGAHDQQHRTGHIAGAGSVPYLSLLNDDSMLRTPAEWKALLDKAGVKPGDTVIGYCHIGMQTTGALLAARTLGHKVLLYDGSFEDWSRRDGHPVDNPSAKGK